MCIRHLNLVTPISLENMPDLWEQNDILILLIDLDIYSVFSTEYLDDTEKEDLDRFKTSYFKKRYIISRTVLKYILHCLIKGKSVSDIVTYKDEYGRVHVSDHKELHICISYTGNIVSLAISKVNVGIDIELRKLFSSGKVSKYLNKRVLESDGFGHDLDLLTLFTLKEAYCKFSNRSILSSLYEELDLNNVFSLSYILNDIYVLSVITDAEPHALNISYLQKIAFHELVED